MTEQEDLEALIKSDGWLRVKQFADVEWETLLERHMTAAANDRDDNMALQKIRQVLAAKQAVARILSWPDDRLSELHRAAQARQEPDTPSRRGRL